MKIIKEKIVNRKFWNFGFWHILFGMLMVVYAFFILSNIRIGYNVFDEGATLYGSLRAMNGELPYRDFWTLYLPGQFYLIALVYKLFSVSLFTVRIFGALINFLLPIIVYFLSIRIAGRSFAIIGPALTVFFSGVWGPAYGYGTTTAVFYSLCSIWFVFDFIEKGNMRSLFFSGLLCAITALTRQDIGFYLLLGTSITILLQGSASRKSPIKTLLVYFLSVSAIFIPAIAYLIARCGLKTVVNAAVIYPLFKYSSMRSIPFPGISLGFWAVPFYLPFVIYAITIIHLAIQYIHKRRLEKEQWMAVIVVLTGIFFFNYTRMRADNLHTFPLILFLLFFSLIYYRHLAGAVIRNFLPQ